MANMSSYFHQFTIFVNPSGTVADYYTTAQQILVSCILSISVLTILSSLVAVFISAGYPRERVDFLRHYAVFNIVSCT